MTIRALVMGDGALCYGALEIVGLLLLLLLLERSAQFFVDTLWLNSMSFHLGSVTLPEVLWRGSMLFEHSFRHCVPF